ncbi:MAG: hypothetical protein HYY48_12710 [Gammaproteobacteria bacterium]|nr:hypothetical protein [Gammaproteobacteria bacterium]
MQVHADHDGTESEHGNVTALDDLDSGGLDAMGVPEETGGDVGTGDEVLELEGDEVLEFEGGDEIVYTSTVMDDGEGSLVHDVTAIPFDGEVVEFTPADGGLSDTVVEQIGAAGAANSELTIATESEDTVLSSVPEAAEASAAPAVTGSPLRISGGHLVGGDASGPSMR